jgi:hypothetical protein
MFQFIAIVAIAASSAGIFALATNSAASSPNRRGEISTTIPAPAAASTVSRKGDRLDIGKKKKCEPTQVGDGQDGALPFNL